MQNITYLYYILHIIYIFGSIKILESNEKTKWCHNKYLQFLLMKIEYQLIINNYGMGYWENHTIMTAALRLWIVYKQGRLVHRSGLVNEKCKNIKNKGEKGLMDRWIDRLKNRK